MSNNYLHLQESGDWEKARALAGYGLSQAHNMGMEDTIILPFRGKFRLPTASGWFKYLCKDN